MKRIAVTALLIALSFNAAATNRGWLGFGFTYHRNGNADGWFFVRDVLRDSPASRAGLRVQDVITHVDDRPLRFRNDAEALASFSSVKPGQRVSFRVRRGESALTLVLTAARR